MEPTTTIIQKKTPWGAILGIGIPVLFILCFFSMILGGALTRILFPKTVVIEKVVSDKNTQQDFQRQNQQNNTDKKETTENKSKVWMLGTSAGLQPLPTEMTGDYGFIITPEGKVRAYISREIEAKWKKGRTNKTQARGCFNGWQNEPVSYTDQYAYVDGNMTPTAIPNDDGTTTYQIDFVFEFWPRSGHYPALEIEADLSRLQNMHNVALNSLKNGYDIRYLVYQQLPS